MTKRTYRQFVPLVMMLNPKRRKNKEKMRVNKIVKNDDNIYSFDGELSEDEHSLVITLGLNFLYAQGLMETMAPSVNVTEVDGTETLN